MSQQMYPSFLEDVGIPPVASDRLTLVDRCVQGWSDGGSGPQKRLSLETIFTRPLAQSPIPTQVPGPDETLMRSAFSFSSTALQPTTPVPRPATSTTQARPARPTKNNPLPNPHFQGKPLRTLNPFTQKLQDIPLAISADDPDVSYLRGANLCRKYYLQGACTGCHGRYGGEVVEGRNQDHRPLNDHEFDCLLFLSRERACDNIVKGRGCLV